MSPGSTERPKDSLFDVGATFVGVKTQSFLEGAALGGAKTQGFDHCGGGPAACLTMERRLIERTRGTVSPRLTALACWSRGPCKIMLPDWWAQF